MYIRKTKKKDVATKKEYYSYQLIESYRSERGPRQRILLNLGSDLELLDLERKTLANRIEEIRSGGRSFFQCADHIESLAQSYANQLSKKQSIEVQDEHEEPDYQTVDLNSVEHERSRTIGVEYLAIATMEKLGIQDQLHLLGLSKRQIQVAMGLITGRLAGCTSERGTFYWLQNLSAFDELLKTDFSRLSLNTVYEAGDKLLMSKDSLEKYLVKKEATLFDLDNTIILYDLTNTYFEGTAKDIDHANRGHSKEKRTDCSLVTLGLVLGKEGFPLRSKILPGNVSEPSSLQGAIEQLTEIGDKPPVIVLDAGIATKDNLAHLRDKGYSYIVSSRSRSCEAPDGLNMIKVKESPTNTVYAGKLQKTEDGEVHLYCHSAQRQEKEKSMCSALQKRFEKDLQIAADALDKKGGIKSYPKVTERIGRLKQKHRKISFYYEVTVLPDSEKVNAKQITWERKEEKTKNRFQGGYILRTYGLDLAADELWKIYTMLTEVEEAFRCLKSDLGLRPVFHQLGERVDAHLFITVLAYHVMQTILWV